MKRFTLVAAAAIALSPAALNAQMNYGVQAPPAKRTFFQAWGGMTVPLWSYSNYVDDIGWTAGGSFILRPSPFNHIRLEGEYHNIGSSFSNGGSASLYGGGIGGGRAVGRGNAVTEGFLVAGLYNISVCTGNLTGGCSTTSEVQFGTKFGANFVGGSGKVKPMIGMALLYTWGSPYASLFTLTGGLRF